MPRFWSSAAFRKSGNLLAWDDLRFPASAVNPPGAESDPDLDATDGCYLFDAGGTEILFFQVQMPHHWLLESEIKPHVHWTKTTSASGNVAWKCRYQIAKLGNAFSGTWTDLSEKTTSAITDNDTANEHLLTGLGTIDMSGADSVSSMIKIEISRIGASEGDTYGADAKLLEFDIHYQIDSAGSETEFTK
jgi:hypothetical protein